MESSLLDYWFSHPEVWFTTGSKRIEVNTVLFQKFGSKWLSLVGTPPCFRMSSVENLLYLDQLTRNFLDLETTSELASAELKSGSALFMAFSLISQPTWKYLKPEVQVFTLLPLRHTGKIPLIDLAISQINKMRDSKNRNSSSPKIYLRFLRVSIARKLELLEEVKPEDSLNSLNSLDPLCFTSCLDSETRARPKLFRLYPHFKPKYPQLKSRLDKTIIRPDRSVIQYVSLSGGVDSMVLSYWLKRNGYDVRLVHLVYGNREASLRELDFICWWSCQIETPLYVRHIAELVRSQGDREFYEVETRKIRFAFYRQVQKHYGQGHVSLGHIKNDLAENFISNLMRGVKVKWGHRGMAPSDLQDGVHIIRPLYWTDKKDIYEFARQYNIPYTINTTPTWSRRGRLRNELVPLITELYGKKALDNIIEFSKKIE